MADLDLEEKVDKTQPRQQRKSRFCFGLIDKNEIWEMMDEEMEEDEDVVWDRGWHYRLPKPADITLKDVKDLFIYSEMPEGADEGPLDGEAWPPEDDLDAVTAAAMEAPSHSQVGLQEIDLGEGSLESRAHHRAGRNKLRYQRPFHQRILAKTLAAFLPHPGKFNDWLAGVGFDAVCLGLLVTATILYALLGSESLVSVIYMPFVAIFAACIGMATPAGGGIVYFPFLTGIVGMDAVNAVAFAMGAQLFGMGFYGTFQWVRRSRESITFWLVGMVVLIAWGGAALSTFAVPVDNEVILRGMFFCFTLVLLSYIIYGLVNGSLEKQDEPIPTTVLPLIFFAIVAFAGGMLVGWIGVGVDTLIFFVLCSVFKVNSRSATVNSILIMGWASLFPFTMNIISGDVPWNFLLMALYGVMLGAKLGPIINQALGRKRILVLFVCLLLVELGRTLLEFLILPIFTSKPFFWQAL